MFHLKTIKVRVTMSRIELSQELILAATVGVGFVLGIISCLFRGNNDNKHNKISAEILSMRKQELCKLIDTEYYRVRNDYEPRMHYINYLERQLKEVNKELQDLEEKQYKLSADIIKCNICQNISKCIKKDDDTKPVCVDCIHDILLEYHAKVTWISDSKVQEKQNT